MDRPTTGGGDLDRPTTGVSRPRTARPTTNASAMYEGDDDGDYYDEEAEELEEEEDDDEGMFSFAPPTAGGVEAPPPLSHLSGLDHQAIAVQQQALAAQLQSFDAATPTQPHSPPNVPSVTVTDVSAPTKPSSPQIELAPPTLTRAPHAAMSPAAAIAAHYQAPHLYPTPPPTAPAEVADATLRARKRQSIPGVTVIGPSDRAYSTALANAGQPPVIELSDDFRAAGLAAREGSIRSSRSSRSTTKFKDVPVPADAMSPTDPDVVAEGWRVAAGGVGAGALKYPGRNASAESMLESNLGPSNMSMREMDRRSLKYTTLDPRGLGVEKSEADTKEGASVVDEGRLSGVDAYRLEDFALDEEDSPYPEVRASVSNIDDPEMPCLTFRAMFIGLVSVSLCSALNAFFVLRYPSPYISTMVVQVVVYPVGKLAARIMPDRIFTIPGGPDAGARSGLTGILNRLWPRWLYAGAEWSLNPGPFNIKEHTVIVLMANASLGQVYALGIVTVMDKFYDAPMPLAFDYLLSIVTQIQGFALAGMIRRFLIWPASMIWPSNLVMSTLLNTFHAEDDDGSDGTMTRFRFFTYVVVGTFAYTWLPSWLFKALSVFSWVCWIKPSSFMFAAFLIFLLAYQNVLVNQLFGSNTGLGLSMLSFDWAQIGFCSSPLVVPWWAEVNIICGFIFFFWIWGPILYYTNAWQQSYLPYLGSSLFDRYGDPYNARKVVDVASQSLNVTAYKEYSPIFLPTSYTSVYSIAFCLATAAIVHTVLYHGHSVWDKIRDVGSEDEDVHYKLMRNYPEVPDWWYLLIFVVSIALSVVVLEVYDTGLPVWGLALANVIVLVYLLPAGFIFAMTTQVLQINLIAEVVPGYALAGKPLPNMLFKTWCVQSLNNALIFAQDLKLGHYMKIPPRVTFSVQIIATLVACVVQNSIQLWVRAKVPDLCTRHQPDGLVCPTASVIYSASIIWGLLGPKRQFGPDTLFHPIIYWVLVGLVLPLPFYFWTKRRPDSWTKYVNTPVLLVGAGFIPPATAVNYTSWFIVGFIFQYLLRRRYFRWWSKFNFLLSAGLDSGTALATIVIFATLVFPKNGKIRLQWWGNTVFLDTADYNGTPYRSPPEGGFGPTSWS